MPDRTSVLHVVDCLNVGGTERQLFELIRRVDRRRFRPLVACFKAKGELLPRLRELGIEPLEFPLGGTLLHATTAVQIARMALYCHLEKVKIIHAHDFYSNLIGVAAAKLAGARAIASRRDLGHWLSPIQRRALRFMMWRSDYVIANAVAVGDLVTRKEGVPAEKLLVVPNGIDVHLFDAEAAREPDPLLPPNPEGLPRVAMVANMHLPDKGHGDLLEAAARLAARGRRAQWLLVSDGALRAQHEERARALGLAVDFLGRRDDVPRILRRVDLVVHPSWAEGFPNVVLEAMCAGRPVVATRVGGCPELIDDDTGLLVEPRQPEALADAVEQLLSQPKRAQKMGERGRRRVEERYSLDRMSASVQSLYESLLRPRPTAATISPYVNVDI
jgi:glycosyltransferase involved in cell wall biosynthesis